MPSPRSPARRRSRSASPPGPAHRSLAHSRTKRRSRSRSPRSRRRSRSPRDGRRREGGHHADSTRNSHRDHDRRRASSPTATATPPLAERVPLPAAAHREELIAALRDHQVVICVGETGSGKTTQLPQYLLDALACGELSPGGACDKRIVVTQPRRVAAVSVAQRVAHEMGAARLRDSRVGYTIRFDDQTSSATRLKFVTDGVLVRECLRDAALQEYAVVVLDEAHERSLHTDILFGLLKRVLATRRDLRLLVTSATLDADRFAAFFSYPSGTTATKLPPVPVVKIPGRVFPVDIFHSKQQQVMGLRGPLSTYVRAAVETTLQVHRSEPSGHILVFLTGQHEIEDACKQIRRLAAEGNDNDIELRVLPLYGALSAHAQREIFQDVPAHVRKVVVATNIAETSLTIDDVRYVIDGGFTKQKAYNPETQLESLVVVPISKVSAQQRAGRAGRTAPGKCFRLYSKDSYEQMLDESVPEIRRTNLANTVLYLKVLGVHDVLSFELLDRPEGDALLDALEQLFVLDAIDEKGNVTTTGKLMAQFPLEPKLSRALIEAIALDCEDDMAAVVAMLSVENVYAQQKKQRNEGEDEDEMPSRDELMLSLAKDDLVDDRGDQLTYLRLFKAFEKQSQQKRHQWCEARELRHRSLSTAISIRQQLLEITSSLSSENLRALRDLHSGSEIRKRSRFTRLRRALCAGFFAHAVRRCNSQSSVYRSIAQEDNDGTGSKVQLLHLHPLSTLNYVAPPMYCIYHELVMTSRPFMRGIVEVEERWVRECAHGKSKITLTQLYALSGRQAPPSDKELSVPKRKNDDPELAMSSNNTAEVEQDDAATKQSAIDAARARFLVRKKPRR